MENKNKHIARPIKVINQKVEVFEIFSEQLKRNITIGLKHNPADELGANLASDAGIVMMPVPMENLYNKD